MMNFKIPVVLLLAGALCSGSVLSNYATALPAHTWVKLPSNASLNALYLNYNFLGYVDSGIWDPVRRQAAIVASGGTCCITSNPLDNNFRRLVYDEATDTWSTATTPYNTQGHGYDSNACNPLTGDHYFAWWDSRTVHKWNGSGWSNLPAMTPSLGNSSCNGLAWFPEFNNSQGGLVFAAGGGGVGIYNGTGWTTQYAPTAWGSIEAFAEYNPVHKVVWLGGGSYSSDASARVTYRLDAQGRLTRLNDAPFSLASSDNTIKTCDPVTGTYLVYKRDSNAWWAFDVMAGSWSQVTNMSGRPNNMNHTFHAPIPAYGVIFVLFQDTREVYLYRHSAFAGAQKNASIAGNGLDVFPNPVRNTAEISFSGGAGGRIGVYDMQGRQVMACHGKTSVRWNTAGLSAGVYLIRALDGMGATESRAIVLK